MIFYFSATGNSHWAATQLSEATNEAIISITSALKTRCNYEVKDDEMIGFVFPVHGWRVPKIVEEFIHTLSFVQNNSKKVYPKKVFCLLTTGDSIGRTMERFLHLLHTHPTFVNAELYACESVIMPESYVGLPFMDVDTAEKEAKKISAAKEKIAHFASIINNAKQREEETKGNKAKKNLEDVEGKHPIGWNSLIRGPIPDFFSGPVGGFFSKFLITDKHFYVNKEKCIKCGICAMQCPVNDIEGGKALMPQWVHNGKCLTCFACYHHCPTKAIAFGNRTKGKGQYYFTKRNK
ncbi:EFR1 family ferrodoxin [Prevotella ihumii]|uniref:EFR1 family ferrodoxin n=1 Tax=Prevotella ihumii TaxID=1917878 RepID=UPI000980EA06|nr:EFR1 family ferrodoxin [Prevotella ihumii]